MELRKQTNYYAKTGTLFTAVEKTPSPLHFQKLLGADPAGRRRQAVNGEACLRKRLFHCSKLPLAYNREGLRRADQREACGRSLLRKPMVM
jgi:hypothetical protein